ncbi:MAG: maleylpyruvate isomerase family mycothiol-dependent enzyme [Actinomycetota bacterium]|nr:maleylpyruvate isomerase family mycothiol-dependent enzyme [Actinomycetota bacterium]
MSERPESSALLAHLHETAAATTRYLEALTVLDETDVRAPSLLPGWSRGHVVTHVARNADGLRNLMVWARTGAEHPQYASWEQRNLDIEAGAGRSVAVLVEDSCSSAGRFADEVENLSGDAWDFPVRTLSSTNPFPARDVLPARRIEVEVHHADLGGAYSSADWPRDFTEMMIARVQRDRSDAQPMVVTSTDSAASWTFGSGHGPEIRGATADLAWWLIGRGEGSGLMSSSGALPELTRWR